MTNPIDPSSPHHGYYRAAQARGLTLTRRGGESFIVGDDVEVFVMKIDAGEVRLKVCAPGKAIDRYEVRQAKIKDGSYPSEPTKPTHEEFDDAVRSFLAQRNAREIPLPINGWTVLTHPSMDAYFKRMIHERAIETLSSSPHAFPRVVTTFGLRKGEWMIVEGDLGR